MGLDMPGLHAGTDKQEAALSLAKHSVPGWRMKGGLRVN